MPHRALLVFLGLSLSLGFRSGAHPHDPTNTAPHGHLVQPTATPSRVIGGTGAFRYEYLPEKLVLPPEVRMKHGHGLCRDSQGYIYFVYEPEKVEPSTRALVRFNPDGTSPILLGSDNALAQGVPHGLNIEVDKQGKAHLYHANNNATVTRTSLTGDIEWSQKWPAADGQL